MPDNSAKIQAIDNALATGAQSVTIDGQAVSYRSLDEMRSVRKALVNADTSGDYTAEKYKRRTFRSINLRGAL